jgi:two-component system, chemotaxis family, chemotaxis protein CheY
MTICLIVDDSPTVRRVVRQIVQALGFTAEEADDGKAALKACKTHLPDVVILDWNMPEMDGLSFLRALRRLPGGGRPVVIFCTTINDLPHIEEALDAGANEYIMKPFDEDILKHKLAQTGVL